MTVRVMRKWYVTSRVGGDVLEVKQLGWFAQVVLEPPSMKNLVSSYTKQGLKQGQSTNTGSPTLQHTAVWIQWALSIQPKIPEISDGTTNGTDHFWNIRDQVWRWSSLTGLVISVGRTEMSLSIWQNCCLQYRSFVFCNQTCGGLGRVFGHAEFPKFLLNGKRPVSFTYKKDQRGLHGKANELMLAPNDWVIWTETKS